MAAARRWLAMTRLLWDALGDVPDRRGRQGRQYELRSVLGIALAAMLAGANDLRAIWRWGRRLRPEALRLFGIESGQSPCHASRVRISESASQFLVERVAEGAL